MTFPWKRSRTSYELHPPRLSAGQLSAAAALLVVAVLLTPQGAQAATTVVNSVITDPAKTNQQAHVDANGNLQVTTNVAPVQVEKFVQFSNQPNLTAPLYTVPAGKRLVIQYLQGTVDYPNTIARPLLEILTTVGGSQQQWVVETTNPGVSGASGFVNFNGSKQVSLYADAGSTVALFVGQAASSTSATVGDLIISGVLVDMPAVAVVTTGT
jgi:hypothetical protein